MNQQQSIKSEQIQRLILDRLMSQKAINYCYYYNSFFGIKLIIKNIK